ncbi:hypothetical protein BRYFOR_06923 [Marvinbryantia formatexigens DSM 14469]|uniref:Uncharacterized protein n=1 Tax=Marvinbryantia formatexigens DSM 14469 TaxID=478749 RepID=C6LE74_9FIRM|nr:hypothetical protein BRYFOR_06923 [Marvinbryantia formatexigens DSM 14469]
MKTGKLRKNLLTWSKLQMLYCIKAGREWQSGSMPPVEGRENV